MGAGPLCVHSGFTVRAQELGMYFEGSELKRQLPPPSPLRLFRPDPRGHSLPERSCNSLPVHNADIPLSVERLLQLPGGCAMHAWSACVVMSSDFRFRFRPFCAATWATWQSTAHGAMRSRSRFVAAWALNAWLEWEGGGEAGGSRGNIGLECSALCPFLVSPCSLCVSPAACLFQLLLSSTLSLSARV